MYWDIESSRKKYKLNELFNIYDGTHTTPNYVESVIPFYSVESVQLPIEKVSKFISYETYESEKKRVQIEKGDLFITRIGKIGDVRLIDYDSPTRFYVTLDLLKPKSNLINTYYIKYALQSCQFKRELWENTLHVAFSKKMNLGELSNLYISIHDTCLKKKISDTLSAIDNLTNIENIIRRTGVNFEN